MKNFQFKRGQAALTAVLFFLFISLALISGFAGFAGVELRSAKTLERSKQSFIFAEGALEDAAFRVISGKNMPSQVVYAEGALVATTTRSDTGNTVTLETAGLQVEAVRKNRIRLGGSPAGPFNYAVQIGNGGLLMENTSQVSGNVYANGPAEGRNQNIIRGEIVSAGAAGLIDGIHATSTAYAHTIRNSTVDGDAYYQIIENTIVGRTKFPGSLDQPTQKLAISDQTIDDWKNTAEAGGVLTCSDGNIHKIENNTTLGPVKIPCDLEISGSPTITLVGNIWVAGNIDIKNSAVLRISPALGTTSVPMIADKPSNRLTSSKIILQNSIEFQNSGTRGSYVLMTSQNNSLESGGSEVAIDIKNTAHGDLLVYAAHGEILMQNNNDLREISGYKVRLKNAAHVIYETGLRSLLFESGPPAGYTIDNWQEIP